MNEEKGELVKLLATLRESFTTAAEAINSYLQALAPSEGGVAVGIANRNSHVYGRIIQRPNELVATPAENITVEAEDPAIQRFLIPKVLNALKQKHGVDYAVESGNGKLKAVRIKGALNQQDVDKLKSALAWAFEKASARAK
jgi:CRISPR/Cas system type I-B associated protein Csh2 (Cas7 group RAMP superfamily)